VLGILAAAATAAAASPRLAVLSEDNINRLTAVAIQPSRVDAATIDHIDAVLQHCMRQEDALGPGPVLETVLAQQHLVQTLIPAARAENVRLQLLSLMANISRFTAWLLFNLSDFRGAEYYYHQARSYAHDADDDAMCSLVLANWSHLCTWTNDPRQGVEHALGALAWGQRANSQLLVSYAGDVGARAYAAVSRRSAKTDRHRDHARCMTSLDEAHHALTRASDDDPAKTLLYFYGSGQFLSTRATCLLDTNNARQAVDVAAVSLAGIRPEFTRNRAFGHINLARAYLQLHDLDAACESIAEAARLTSQNTSPRLVHTIVTTREILNPWNATHQVAALDEKLHTYQLNA
jgi:tetratricopeptide (TPR) repeat protein